MRKLLHCFFLVFIANSLNAQGYSIDWIKHYGGDAIEFFLGPFEACNKLITNHNGYIYSTGIVVDSVHLDSDTNLLGSNYYSRTYLSKSDSVGNLIWFKQFDKEYEFSNISTMDVSKQGDIYYSTHVMDSIDLDLSDTTNLVHPVYSSNDGLLVKYSTNASLIWYKRLSGYITLIKTDLDGSVVVIGSFLDTLRIESIDTTYILPSGNAGYFKNYFVARYNSLGGLVWINILNSNQSYWSYDEIKDLEISNDGTIYISGNADEKIDFDPSGDTLQIGGNSNMGFVSLFIASYQSNGLFNWAKEYEPSDSITLRSYSASIDTDSLGNIIVSTQLFGICDVDITENQYIINTHGEYYLSISKYSPDIELIWNRTFVSSNSSLQYGGLLAVDNNDNILISGSYRGELYATDSLVNILSNVNYTTDFILKLDSSGNLVWANKFIVNFGMNTIHTIEMANSELYLGGMFSSSADFDMSSNNYIQDSYGGFDVFIAKYSPCFNTFLQYNIVDCNSYHLPSGREVFFSGSYQDTIPNHLGCDSILTINLTLLKSYSSPNIQECSSYLAPDGTILNHSGSYDFVIQNSMGCDSIISLHLTILNSSSINLVNTCHSYTAPDSTIYYTSGLISSIIPNSFGCDSVIYTNLVIHNLNTAILVTDSNLTSLSVNSQYQWALCTNVFEIIPNAINSTFFPSENGDYALILSQDGCVDTTMCYSFVLSGIEDIYSQNIGIFPNPGHEHFDILLQDKSNITELKLYDMQGRQINNHWIVNDSLSSFDFNGNPGFYILQVNFLHSSQYVKFIKL
ncbi:MAG TPA: T9SS type A sorting domain-containing protein [Flavobacteriales bacterium]|nr:T9SS type A sorting domain-containing protein [Flavobacteriales bacterium]